MAIVYECPTCEFQGKAGDDAAGKEITCKGCGDKFKLPDGNGAPAQESAPVAPASAGTVAIKCPACGASGKAPLAAQGKKIKCPKCSQQFVVSGAAAPASGPAAVLSDSGPPAPREKAALPDDAGLAPLEDADSKPAKKDEPQGIATVCPKCQRQGKVPEKFLGKKVKCPKCATPFVVADPQAAKAPAGANLFGLGEDPAAGAVSENPFLDFDYAAPPAKKDAPAPVTEDKDVPPPPGPKKAKKQTADEVEDEDDEARPRSLAMTALGIIGLVVIVGLGIAVYSMYSGGTQVAKGTAGSEDGPDSMPALKPFPGLLPKAKTPPPVAPSKTDAVMPDKIDGMSGDAKAGDVLVRAVGVWIDVAKGIEGESKTRHLMIQLQIVNEGKETPVDYRGWGSNPVVPGKSGAPKLTDQAGKAYRRLTPGDVGVRQKGQLDTAVIKPGETVADILVFEVPAGAVEVLRIELPAVNLGKEGFLRFSLPGALLSGGPPR